MPQAQKKAFALRLDPALHDAVERLAAQELRSVNAELEVLIREALKKRGIEVPVTPRPRRGRPRKGEGS
ncbi:MAG: Arc family DNA-binding protein [Alteraurantiacibacter sp.]